MLIVKNFPYKRINDLLKQHNTMLTVATVFENKYPAYGFYTKFNKGDRIHIVKLENNKYHVGILKHEQLKKDLWQFTIDKSFASNVTFKEVKQVINNILS